MKCKTCKYKYLCQNYGKECDKWEKEPYSIVVEEGGIKRIERIEEK